MKRIEEIIAACLEDIEAGAATVEECLERYPELSGELEPLLRLAVRVESLPEVMPSAAFKSRARATVMEYVRSHPVKHSPGQAAWMLFGRPGWARAGVVALAVLVLLAGTGTGTAYASQSSLPGDLLYPVKTGVESWRAWVETDAAGDAALQLEFAGRRIQEMERLTGKSAKNVYIATSGYEKNLERALRYARAAPGVTPLEEVAVAIGNHLGRLDRVEDITGGTSLPGIAEAEQIAVTEQIRSLSYLSETSPVRASEMTIAAMQDRLRRAAGAANAGNTVRAEHAVRQFIRYAGLGEEINETYAGTGMSVETLYDEAARNQQQIFNSFSAQVSPELADQARLAFQRMERKRGQEPGGQSQGPGNQGQEPGQNDQGPGNQGQGQGNQGPSGQSQEPGNQGEGPGNQDQEPGNQEPGGQSQEPGNQGQEPGQNDQEPGDQGQDGGQGGGSGAGPGK